MAGGLKLLGDVRQVILNICALLCIERGLHARRKRSKYVSKQAPGEFLEHEAAVSVGKDKVCK